MRDLRSVTVGVTAVCAASFIAAGCGSRGTTAQDTAKVTGTTSKAGANRKASLLKRDQGFSLLKAAFTAQVPISIIDQPTRPPISGATEELLVGLGWAGT